jgi:hypothetical protein
VEEGCFRWGEASLISRYIINCLKYISFSHSRFVRLLTTRCGVSEPMECGSSPGSETPKPLRTPLEFGDVEEKEEKKVVKDVRLSHVHIGTCASPLNSGCKFTIFLFKAHL